MIAIVCVASIAAADKLDPRRPADFVVGLPKGPSPTARIDVGRRAQTDVALPRTVRLDWNYDARGATLEAPVVNDKGETAIVNTRSGEITWIDDKGIKLLSASVQTYSSTSAPTLLADGTVVIVTGDGRAIGVTKTGKKFEAHLGGDRGALVAPLPLEDGGVVVATATELTALDSAGAIRAKTTLPDSLAPGALLAAGGRVLAVAGKGVVYAWSVGREAVRVGSFGGDVDGGASVLSDHALVAVVDQNRIVALDLDRGVPVPRAGPTQGAYLGPLAVRGNNVYGMLQTATQTFVVEIDSSGQEVLRASVANSVALTNDAGTFQPSPHTGVIVDASGTIAFATSEGEVGIVVSGVVTRASSPCTGHPAKIQALVPAAPGAFIAVCQSGRVARFSGS